MKSIIGFIQNHLKGLQNTTKYNKSITIWLNKSITKIVIVDFDLQKVIQTKNKQTNKQTINKQTINKQRTNQLNYSFLTIKHNVFLFFLTCIGKSKFV